jgi:hypothetical protein
MTPYELTLYIEAVSERKEVETQEKLTLVWMGEYYHRLKRLPKLQEELKRLSGGNSKKMTDEEMLETVKALNAQFGGTFEK